MFYIQLFRIIFTQSTKTITIKKNTTMCTCSNERSPIPIAAGTPLPLRIPVFGQIGKRPIIIVQIVNSDGTETTAPNVTTTKEYSTDGFVQVVIVDDADGGGGFAADNLNVDIYPQNIVKL